MFDISNAHLGLLHGLSDGMRPAVSCYSVAFGGAVAVNCPVVDHRRRENVCVGPILIEFAFLHLYIRLRLGLSTFGFANPGHPCRPGRGPRGAMAEGNAAGDEGGFFLKIARKMRHSGAVYRSVIAYS